MLLYVVWDVFHWWYRRRGRSWCHTEALNSGNASCLDYRSGALNVSYNGKILILEKLPTDTPSMHPSLLSKPSRRSKVCSMTRTFVSSGSRPQESISYVVRRGISLKLKQTSLSTPVESGTTLAECGGCTLPSPTQLLLHLLSQPPPNPTTAVSRIFALLWRIHMKQDEALPVPFGKAHRTTRVFITEDKHRTVQIFQFPLGEKCQFPALL